MQKIVFSYVSLVEIDRPETLVNFYKTRWLIIPEDDHGRENLKCHIIYVSDLPNERNLKTMK